MIDFFALALSHGLLVLAALRILMRRDLDSEDEASPPAAAEPPPRKKPGLRLRA